MRGLNTWLMVAMFGASFCVGAQTVGSNAVPGQGDTYHIMVSSHLVVETVVVKDKKGNFINGLTARDFNVTEDGVPQPRRIKKISPSTTHSTEPSLCQRVRHTRSTRVIVCWRSTSI